MVIKIPCMENKLPVGKDRFFNTAHIKVSNNHKISPQAQQAKSIQIELLIAEIAQLCYLHIMLCT